MADELGKNTNFVAKASSVLGLKGDKQFHQEIRASKSSSIQRYSPAALDRLRQVLRDNPDYNPYKAGR